MKTPTTDTWRYRKSKTPYYEALSEAIRVLNAQKDKCHYAKIVRCGECKYNEDEEPGMVYCPKIVGSWVSENWYCADGEREVQE